MKKYLMLLSAVGLLWPGCSDKDDEGTGGSDNLKLVDNITVMSYDRGQVDETYTMKFSYDASNRVTKIEGNSDFELLTITYSGNKVTLIGSDILSAVLTLDADGKVISGTQAEDYEDEKEIRNWIATYENGYVSQAAYDVEYVPNKDPKTPLKKYDFTWSGGNLTKVVEELESKEPWTTVLKYGTQALDPRCPFDLNLLVANDENMAFSMMPWSVSFLGLYGKPSTNLLSESTDNYIKNKITYTWELDSDGFVTKATSVNESSSGSYTVYTVTYK